MLLRLCHGVKHGLGLLIGLSLAVRDSAATVTRLEAADYIEGGPRQRDPGLAHFPDVGPDVFRGNAGPTGFLLWLPLRVWSSLMWPLVQRFLFAGMPNTVDWVGDRVVG